MIRLRKLTQAFLNRVSGRNAASEPVTEDGHGVPPPSPSDDIEALRRVRDAARKARRSGDLKTAARLLETALETAPDDAMLLKNLANVRFDGADYAGAMDALERVRAQEPLGDHTTTLYARAGLRAGEYAKVHGFLGPVCETQPENAALHFLLLDAATGLGEEREIRAVLDRLVALAPDKPAQWMKIGRSFRSLGDEDGANAAFAKGEETVETLLADASDDPSLLADLAQFRFELADYTGAVDALDRARQQETLTESTVNLYARACLRAGDYAKAHDFLGPVCETQPENAALHFFLLDAATGLGEADDIRAVLQRLVALDLPKQAQWLRIGQIFRALEDTDEAHAAFARGEAVVDTLLTEAPDDPALLSDLADLRFELEDFTGTVEALDRMRAQQPLSDPETSLYARAGLRAELQEKVFDVLSPICKARPELVDTRFYLLEAATRLGKEQDARAVLHELVALAPQKPAEWLRIGRSFRSLGNPDEAHAAFARGKTIVESFLTAAPDDPSLLFELADIRFELADYTGTVKALDRVRAQAPLSDSGINLYARAGLRAWMHQQVFDVMSQICEARPEHVDARIRLYEAATRLGKEQEARAILLDLAEHDSTDAADWFKIGRVLRAAGEHDRAVASFEKAGSLGADEHAVAAEIADSDLKQGLLTLVRAQLDELLAAKPDDVKSLYLLARLKIKQGSFHEAREPLERVIGLAPTHFNALKDLAMICAHEARHDEAIAMYQRALNVEPNSASAMTDLATIHLQKGRYEKAKALAEKALQIQPDWLTARKVMSNLGVFFDTSAEPPRVTVICPPEHEAAFRDLDAVAETLTSEPPGLQAVAYRAAGDWTILARDLPDPSDHADLIQRIREPNGALLRRGEDIVAIRTGFLRDAARAFGDPAAGAADFERFLKQTAREIYPRLAENGAALLPQTAKPSGQVMLVSTSGHTLYGGAEHFLRDLAGLYAEMGFEPLLLSHRGKATRDGVTPEGIRFIEFEDGDDQAFRAFVLKNRPALAHVVTGSGTFILQNAGDLELPVIYGTHFWREMFRGEGWLPNIDRVAAPRPEFRALMLRTEAAYVNSVYTLDMQYRHHALTSDIMYSLAATPTETAKRDGRDIVLLANARPEKGFDMLLQIAARCPETEFVAIASQSVETEAKAAIRRAELENIEIIGWVDDMDALYRRAWCVLVPSYSFVETFSRVVVEAHRHGVPVIGSDRGNVPILLARSGVSLPEDADAWAAELNRLERDTEYWKTRSRRATENSERYAFAQQRPVLDRLVQKAMRPVLVAVGAGIGNIIQCAPAIRRLSEHLGQPVDVVINQDFPGCEWLMAGSPHVGMVFGSDTEYVRRRYELVVVLASFGKAVPKFNARRTVIGREKMPFEATVSMHESKYNLECLAAAGLGVEYAEADVAKYFVGNYEPTGLASRRIVLHSGGKPGQWEVKRWPYFEALAADLQARGWEVISTGSASEYVEGTVDRTGTPLRETIATIQDAAYVIANDSGLMHVADGIGVPLTAIFGPTSVVKNGPLAPTSQVVALEKDCAPCQFNERFHTCKCIAELSLETVRDRVLAHLEEVTQAKQPAE